MSIDQPDDPADGLGDDPIDDPADGGPAFPSENRPGVDAGMSLRDHFAGLAMQAMIGAITQIDDAGIIRNRPSSVAELAYLYAECMLEQRRSAQGD